MTANVAIIVAQKDDVLKVPNAALRFTPPKSERTESFRCSGSDNPDRGRAGRDDERPSVKHLWKLRRREIPRQFRFKWVSRMEMRPKLSRTA